MTIRLRVGMGDSYGLRFTTLAGDDFVPASVTGATFKVTKPTASGTESVEWVGSIGEQTTGLVEALYAFNANGLDLDYPGTWKAWVQWTVPGESPGPRTEVVTFQVLAADQVV